MQTTIKSFLEIRANSDYRWDAEFYRELYKKNTHYKYIPIRDILKRIQYGISIDMNERGEGFKIYRMNEIHNMMCDLDVAKYASIDKEEAKKFLLEKDDILFNRTNSFEFVGRTGIYKISDNENRVFASYLIRLQTKSNMILPEYLTVFFNTKIGIFEIKKRARISINQSNVNAQELQNIEIPLLSLYFQNILKKLFDCSFLESIFSTSNYIKAENLLLEELGLKDWKPKHQLSFVKSFSDSQASNRIDAEYFQPKYDEIIAKIKTYSNGFDKLQDIVKIKKGIEIGSEAYKEEGIPFVRVSNLNKFEISENNQQYLSEEYYNELAYNYQPKKDEILLSKDGTAGLAYHLNTSPKKMITSGGLLRLQINNKDYFPEYLTLVLNSLIVQQQIEQVISGAIIKHWLVDQVNNTLIPKLDNDKQKEIAFKVQESFKARELSKQLLEIAKHGVEIAIEQDETIATAWINDEISKLGVSL